MKRFLILLAFGCQLLVAQQIKFFNTYGHGIYDSGEGVWTSKDTGYVVAGITTQTGSNGTDMLIYKVDSIGTLKWYKNIGIDNSMEGAKSITSGNGAAEYILAGYQNKYDTSGYNFYVVKTDLNGDTLWTRTFGGADWDMAYSVDTLQDSTYVIAGETYSFGNGNSDMYVIRIDKNGDTLWTRTFGGPEDDYARYVFTDRHDNIMLVGTTFSFGAGGADAYFIYLNAMGDTIWTKSYGTASDDYGYSGDMYIDNINKMSFAFGYTSYYGPQDAQKMRFYRGDSTNCSFIADVGVLTTNVEIVDHPRIRKDGKGKYYYCSDVHNVGGLTDIFLSKTFYAFGFDLASSLLYIPDIDMPHDIRKCFDNGYITTGETQSFGPGSNASFILKTDTFFVSPLTALVAVEENELGSFSAYPNPVSDNILYLETNSSIEQVILFDMNGRMLQTIQGQHYTMQQLQLNPLPIGMYILAVRTDHGIGRKKILITN
jgi:hypothetical protein